MTRLINVFVQHPASFALRFYTSHKLFVKSLYVFNFTAFWVCFWPFDDFSESNKFGHAMK